MSSERVASAESSGLRDLRAAAREFGCAGGSSGSSSGGSAGGSDRQVGLAVAATGTGFTGETSVGTAMASADDGTVEDKTRDKGAVAGVSASSDSQDEEIQSVDPASAQPPVAASDNDSDKAEPSLLLLLFVLPRGSSRCCRRSSWRAAGAVPR